MPTPSPTPAIVRKVTLGTIVGWVLGVFMSMSAFGAFLSGDIVAGILTALMAIILLPPGIKMLRERLHLDLSTGARVAIILVLLFGIGFTIGQTPAETPAPTPVPTNAPTEQPTPSGTTQEERDYANAMVPVLEEYALAIVGSNYVIQAATVETIEEDFKKLLPYRDDLNLLLARMNAIRPPPRFQNYHALIRASITDYRDALTLAERGARINDGSLLEQAAALIERADQRLDEATAELESIQ